MIDVEKLINHLYFKSPCGPAVLAWSLVTSYSLLSGSCPSSNRPTFPKLVPWAHGMSLC